MPKPPSVDDLRAFVLANPEMGGTAVADAMSPGCSMDERRKLASRANVMRHSLRHSGEMGESASLKPSTRGRRQAPRQPSQPRQPPALVVDLPQPVQRHNPPTDAIFTPVDSVNLTERSPLERRQWLLEQATRGILGGDPAAQAFQSAITKVQQVLISLEEIEDRERATRPRRTMEEILREIASRADEMPLALLEPIVQIYCDRTRQTLSPRAA